MTATTDDRDRTGTDDTASRNVFAPSGLPGAAVLGAVIGLLMLVLCGVAIRDLVVAAGWTDGDPWLAGAAHWSTETSWTGWMWAAAIACVVVGLGMLAVAVKPRRPTHLRLAGHDVLWTRRVDVARRCSAAAESVSGVEHATTVVTRRKATCTVTARDSTDRDHVREVVESVIGDVESPKRAVVRFPNRRGGGRR
ncbi:DUF6286 domain-containing protein [Gordonia liuliyuniae]|uniref:Alkaline shock response membrane anchor protein AmaP n=1 Tax=Gordonia liuliyuniae TaxID=2911517 RepID=A0ABS9ITZ4_9ACTN|nr:DUF6286 domain-containing protein [Gordonia liuliyuniae]MCF8589029.1 alkaline shock response membrane anchor protein AmaP [Gordonia liuliyuniae]